MRKSTVTLDKEQGIVYDDSHSRMKLISFIKTNVLYIVFAVALFAAVGSLFFSEVLHYPPCILCWYQRIAMYPLIYIAAVGILRSDANAASYILPFSVTGLAISIYHNLLYYNILPESIRPCAIGVSCVTKYINWFGVITIPMLSFLSFAFITVCVLIAKGMLFRSNANTART